MTPAVIPIADLSSALELGDRELVSLVGGGGKTTALFALGRQLTGTVILSTSTKMGSDRTGGHHPLIAPSAHGLATALARHRVVLAWKGVKDHRALGFDVDECADFARLADHVVIEADGSRRKPFKAPADHEPVVPGATTVLIACVGAAAFDAPISASCHRPESVAEVAGCRPDDRLRPDRLAAVLTSNRGSRKGCPPTARFVVLLNQVTDGHRSFVEELCGHLGDDVPVVAVAPFAPEDSPEA